jgi:hypothetical protein
MIEHDPLAGQMGGLDRRDDSHHVGQVALPMNWLNKLTKTQLLRMWGGEIPIG